MTMHSPLPSTNKKLIPVLSPGAFTYKSSNKNKSAKETLISNNLDHANHMLDEANDIIRTQETRIKQLEKMLQTDELTNLINRRAFVCTMNRELARLRREENGSALLILIDIDDFSTINKHHGRSIGDAYLQTVASVLLNEVRTMDTVARLENDRFAILLTGIDTQDSGARLTNLQKTLHSRVMHHREHSIPLSTSFGYAVVNQTETADSLLLAADMKLYGNKAHRKIKTKAPNKKQ